MRLLTAYGNVGTSYAGNMRSEFLTPVNINTRGNERINNTETCSRNQCRRGKAISISYSECVFAALVIQRAVRVCCIILKSVACLAVTYFTHYLINDTIFGKTLPNINVLIFSTNFARNISCYKKN